MKTPTIEEIDAAFDYFDNVVAPAMIIAELDDTERRHCNTIRFALKLAKVVMGEPSQGFPSMAQAGAVEMWEQCKDGLIGHPQATAVFKAMIEVAIKEAQDE